MNCRNPHDLTQKSFLNLPTLREKRIAVLIAMEIGHREPAKLEKLARILRANVQYLIPRGGVGIRLHLFSTWCEGPHGVHDQAWVMFTTVIGGGVVQEAAGNVETCNA